MEVFLNLRSLFYQEKMELEKLLLLKFWLEQTKMFNQDQTLKSHTNLRPSLQSSKVLSKTYSMTKLVTFGKPMKFSSKQFISVLMQSHYYKMKFKNFLEEKCKELVFVLLWVKKLTCILSMSQVLIWMLSKESTLPKVSRDLLCNLRKLLLWSNMTS